MKAAIYDQYGPPDVIRIATVPKPLPKEYEVLIRIHATTVNSGDARLRRADPFLVRLMLGLLRPRKQILGVDVAGVVESIGSRVSAFKVGDEVFGSATDHGMGAHAEYICLPEDSVLTCKPANLTFGESAAVFFGAHTALHYLRKGKIEETSAQQKKILIYGASGAVGVYAVQLARHFGAKVHGVCSTKNLALVKSLGATRVFDYTREDFITSGEEYDIIFDTVGKSPFVASVRALRQNGFYLRTVHLALLPVLRGLWTGFTSSKTVIGGVAVERREDLVFLKELLEKGILKPVIDRRYPLAEIAEAHRYVDGGHKVGSVVIDVVG